MKADVFTITDYKAVNGMRIEAYNKVSNIYQTATVKKTEKVKTTATYDQVEISRQGQDYQVAKKAVKDAKDVRMDRVNDIKSRMASGTYNVTMKEVADKLVDSYFDQTI